jgi:hypothetical protein
MGVKNIESVAAFARDHIFPAGRAFQLQMSREEVRRFLNQQRSFVMEMAIPAAAAA